MKKTFEQRQKAFRATCQNMARLLTNQAKYQIGCGRSYDAAKDAAAAARWAFHGFPELRDMQ